MQECVIISFLNLLSTGSKLTLPCVHYLQTSKAKWCTNVVIFDLSEKNEEMVWLSYTFRCVCAKGFEEKSQGCNSLPQGNFFKGYLKKLFWELVGLSAMVFVYMYTVCDRARKREWVEWVRAFVYVCACVLGQNLIQASSAKDIMASRMTPLKCVQGHSCGSNWVSNEHTQKILFDTSHKVMGKNPKFWKSWCASAAQHGFSVSQCAEFDHFSSRELILLGQERRNAQCNSSAF